MTGGGVGRLRYAIAATMASVRLMILRPFSWKSIKEGYLVPERQKAKTVQEAHRD